MKHFVHKFIYIHDIKLSYRISDPQLSIVVIERLQLLIGLRPFQYQSEIHQSDGIEVFVIPCLQILQSYLFSQIHLQQLKYQTQKFGWFFGPSIQTTNVLNFDSFVDKCHLVQSKALFFPVSAVEYPMSGELVDNLHRFGIVSHLCQPIYYILSFDNNNIFIQLNQRTMGNQQQTEIHHSQAPSYLSRKDSRTLLMRNPPTMHHLRSQSRHHNGSQISRKWKFCSREHAEAKFRNLKQKMNDELYCKYFLCIKDVQFSKTNTNQDQTIFWVNAKIESPFKNLKKEIEERSLIYRNYCENQLWSMMNLLIQIGEIASIPQDIAEFYLTADNKIKLKDPEILTEIKVSKQNIQTQNPVSQSQKLKIIGRHIVSLSLLEKTEKVAFHDINKVNLKYSTNLAAILYKIIFESQSCTLTFENILKILQDMKVDRNVKAESLSNFKASFCLRKNSNFEQIYKKQNDQNSSKQITQDIGKHIDSEEFCTENNENSQKNDSIVAEIQNATQRNAQIYKRVQAINPKKINPSWKSEKISRVKTIIGEEQEKQNCNKENESIQSSRNTNKTSLKTSLDVDEHQFPKAAKILKKQNASLEDNAETSQGEKNPENSHKIQENSKEESNNKCQLFNDDQSDESLLESIIQSDGSIIVKTSEGSPVMNLDEEIQAITRDFLKLQEEFLEQQQKEERISSLADFHNGLRNSTIIQVTEENEESDSQDSIRLQAISKNNTSMCQNSISLSQQEGGQKFAIEEYEGGSRYEGYVVNGLRHGFGKLFYEDGGSYEGNWKNGQIDGFGKLYYQSGNLAYEGEWEKGEFHGFGKIFNESPQEIVGPFDYTDFSQLGTAWEWYEGYFKNDQKHGKGTLVLGNGQKLTGYWELNNVEGKCIFESLRGQMICGLWTNNLLEDRLDE